MIDQFNNYNIIKSVIIDSNNKMRHYALNKSWYLKTNNLPIYDLIFDTTAFLDIYQPSLRERIYYIQLNLIDIVKCRYCKINKVKFAGFTNGFRKTCGSSECAKASKSEIIITRWNNMSDEDKRLHGEKSSKNNKGRKYSDEIRQRMREYWKGKNTTTPESRRKAVETRRNNGNPWHSESTKRLLSESNKKTYNSPEYIEKMKSKDMTEVRKKISMTMKQKILNGEFTPNITNSWTKWDAYINLEHGKRKKFRSCWDACFWYANQHLEYEIVRIPYIFDGIYHNYIVDFVDIDKKILYEIKPKSEQQVPKNIIKAEYAMQWCIDNDFKYIIIDDDWFKENVKKIDLETQPLLIDKMKQFVS